MARTDHVILRNGSASRAEPRPTPAARSDRGPAESPAPPAALAGAYGDSKTVGTYDLGEKVFNKLHGKNLTPRHELPGGDHIEAGKVDQQALARRAAPLT